MRIGWNTLLVSFDAIQSLQAVYYLGSVNRCRRCLSTTWRIDMAAKLPVGPLSEGTDCWRLQSPQALSGGSYASAMLIHAFVLP